MYVLAESMYLSTGPWFRTELDVGEGELVNETGKQTSQCVVMTRHVTGRDVVCH